jgi:hypothetical protein
MMFLNLGGEIRYFHIEMGIFVVVNNFVPTICKTIYIFFLYLLVYGFKTEDYMQWTSV